MPQEQAESIFSRLVSAIFSREALGTIVGGIITVFVIWAVNTIITLKSQNQDLEKEVAVLRKWINCNHQEDEFVGRYKFMFSDLRCVPLPDDPKAVPVDPDLASPSEKK